MRRVISSTFAALLLGAALGGPAAAQGSATPSAGVVPGTLVLGLVPSREADVLVETARPLAEYLTATLGIPVASFVPTDYTGLVVAMDTGQAHVGLFGPFALLQAQDVAGADIVLQAVRRGGTSYHAQWMTNDPATYCADEPVADESGLLHCNGTLEATRGPVGEEALARIPAGTTVSFVEQSSASGYIFPVVQLMRAGIDPAAGIDALFAGGQDNSVLAVCNEDASVGVSFDDARTILQEGDCPDIGRVVVFAYSGEIPNDGVAVASDLDPALKSAITDALVAYADTEEGRAVLLEIYGIEGFVAPDLAAFDIVRDAAEAVSAPE